MQRTFLFTDVQGSTRLWQLAPAAMEAALARHDTLVPGIAETHGGRVFKALGDGFCVVFERADHAVTAVVEIQAELRADPIVVGDTGERLLLRAALHTGPALERGGDFFGITLSEVARLRDVGHGGQILLSSAAETALEGDRERYGLVDLGLHGLRDLSRPIRVFQVSTGESFPPLRSLGAYRQNLPTQLSSFIGREAEVATLRGLLRQRRLVTLTGFGGVGKTRLALQVAAEVLDDFADGVWLVALAPLTEPGFVASSLADVVGAPERPGASALDAVVEDLREKRTLLVLDNCEHVLEEAATAVDRLLRECPRVHVLATSRGSLRVGGEQVWEVPRLPVPSAGQPLPDSLLECPSVALFQDRATAVRHDFGISAANSEAIARICSRLDGLPLALELAAARVRSLSPQQIADRLDQRFRLLTGGSRTQARRQQTLEACISWSHDLLTEAERIVFRRLAVFAGGFTLDAAEGICTGAGVDEYDVLDILERLVDQCLVVADVDGNEARYGQLESIRAFAAARLDAVGEQDAGQERHAAYYGGLAERLRSGLAGSDQQGTLGILEAEADNLRAAFALFESRPERFLADHLKLAADLWKFWYIRGQLREGLGRLRYSLAGLQATGGPNVSDALRARALIAAGNLACPLGLHAEARAWLQAGLALHIALGDTAGEAGARINLGVVAREEGDLPAAWDHFERGLALSRKAGRTASVAAARMNLAGIAQERGDFSAAETLYLEVLGERSDPWRAMLALHGLADLRLRQGNPADARDLGAEALVIALRLDAHTNLPRLVASLAMATLQLGDLERAAMQFGAAEALREQAGTRLSDADEVEVARHMALLRASLAPGDLAACRETGRGLAFGKQLHSLAQTA